MITRPMLASSRNLTTAETKHLRFPVYATEKLDGILCVIGIRPKGKRLRALSRTLKELPNCHIAEWAESCFAGMQGELIIPGHSFHAIQSKVMSNVTLPFNFVYRAFDCWDTDPAIPHHRRLQRLQNKFGMYRPDNTVLHLPNIIENYRDLNAFYESVIAAGGEGLIVRDPNAGYKQGRATFDSQSMLKMKAFEDAEAVVIGIIEEQENQNEKTISRTGQSKRSSHQANKKGKGTMGALVVRDLKTDIVFQIGSGFTAEQRSTFSVPKNILEVIVTYKHQPHGRKDKPRTPIFKGIRRD